MKSAIIQWGRKSQPRRYRNDLPDYPQYMFIVVTSGSLRVEWVDDHNNSHINNLQEQSVLLLPPSACFVLSTPEQAYSGHFVEVEPERSDWPAMVSIASADKHVQRCIAEIEDEYAAAHRDSALPALYQLLYSRCCQLLRQEQQQPQLRQQVDALLRAHVGTDARLSEILAPLPWSPRHLRRCYQEQSGQSIRQAYTAIKMQEACRLLRSTGMSITAIAYELAYPSSQYFSTIFKQLLGQTPSRWREHVRQQD